MKDEIIMFQLAGPRSHAILQETLNLCNINTENIKINEDAHKVYRNIQIIIIIIIIII